MSYDGPSLSEWLAEYRSRRRPTEVAMFEARLPQPIEVMSQRVVSLRIARYNDPDNPNPDRGFYLFTVTAAGDTVSDTWHETVEDALDAGADYGVDRSGWSAAAGAAPGAPLREIAVSSPASRSVSYLRGARYIPGTRRRGLQPLEGTIPCRRSPMRVIADAEVTVGTPGVEFDKQEQYDKIQSGLLNGENILVVFDCIGAGTGFIGLTNLRIILQDNSLVGKKVALTSIPYSRVQTVGYLSNKSVFGKFASTSEVAILAGSKVYECQFRGDDKARFVHDTILFEITD